MVRAACLFALLASSLAFAAEPVRVSVLYFDVQSNQKELGVLAKGLSELMITDLVQSTDLTVVERSRIEDVLAELKLGETRFSDPKTAAKIGKLIGAQFMVIGTIVEAPKLGGGIGPHRLLVRIVDVEKSAAMAKASIKAELDLEDVFATEERVVADVSKLLVESGAAKVANEPPKKAHKLPVGTAVKYSRALDAKDMKDKAQAVQLLNEVVKEQPDFKLAQLDLLNLTK